MAQPAPQPTATPNPPAGGQLARLEAEIDATWCVMRQPKTTARQMTACYRRLAELRQQIAALEIQK